MAVAGDTGRIRNAVIAACVSFVLLLVPALVLTFTPGSESVVTALDLRDPSAYIPDDEEVELDGGTVVVLATVPIECGPEGIDQRCALLGRLPQSTTVTGATGSPRELLGRLFGAVDVSQVGIVARGTRFDSSGPRFGPMLTTAAVIALGVGAWVAFAASPRSDGRRRLARRRVDLPPAPATHARSRTARQATDIVDTRHPTPATSAAAPAASFGSATTAADLATSDAQQTHRPSTSGSPADGKPPATRPGGPARRSPDDRQAIAAGAYDERHAAGVTDTTAVLPAIDGAEAEAAATSAVPATGVARTFVGPDGGYVEIDRVLRWAVLVPADATPAGPDELLVIDRRPGAGPGDILVRRPAQHDAGAGRAEGNCT